ncbi:MAG TPA: type II toxin-antitoxin system VapC family toxin [Chloroflexota bacterium]|nr:type II toxin-antitoxin system VapC family toxin [Chloroflexota bacterium]
MSALYLDAAALVKLVQLEADSAALRAYLAAHPTDRQVTSVLSRSEVVRAVWAGGVPALQQALTVVDRTDQLALTRAVLDQAGALLPGVRLRALDAIHLASALALGGELRALITYDVRLVQAAAALGLVTFAPT